MGVYVKHTEFVIERELPGSPRRAFSFWSEQARKRQWTSCHPDWTVEEDRFDFRIGGGESLRWRTRAGIEHGMRAHYLDIVPGRQIIYAYAMTGGTRAISASLVTVEFAGKGARTVMTYTEQAAFADAADARARSSGTGIGFDRLVLAIEQGLAISH